MRLNEYLGQVPVFVSTLTSVIVMMLGVLLTMKGQFSAGMILAFQGF